MSNNEYGATHATLPSCFTSRKRSSVRLGIKKLPALGYFTQSGRFFLRVRPLNFMKFVMKALRVCAIQRRGFIELET